MIARAALGALLAAQLIAAPALAQSVEIGGVPLSDQSTRSPAPPLVVPAPPPAASPAAPRDDVIVEIGTDERRAPGQRRPAAVGLEPAEFGAERCLAPCGKPFPRGGYYRITGDGLLPSETFQLPVGGSHVTLDPHMGTKAAETTGAVLAVSGGAAIVVALVYSLGVAINNGGSFDEGPPPTRTQTDIVVGGMIGGFVAIVVGGILYLASGTTVRSTGAPLRFGPPVENGSMSR